MTAVPDADRPLPPSGPDGFSAWDLVSRYRFPPELDGSGISIALVRLFGGFRRSDVEQYFAAAGRAAPAVETVSLGGQANNPVADPPANTELVRDLEILGTAAPGAGITVYFADNTEQGVADGIASAVHDRERDHSIICLTWEVPEAEVSPMLGEVVDGYLQDAALMGKLVCAPAGSPAADGLVPYYPGTDPLVLSCAATRAVAAGDDLVERPVPAGPVSAVASQRQARPKWQARTGGRDARKIRGRLVPDVSSLADADHGYRCYLNGGWVAVPGVGAAVCMWAGLLARVQQRAGRPGLLLPDLYQRVGPGGALAPVDPGSSRGGWSPATGWGTPDGQRLLAALSTTGR